MDSQIAHDINSIPRTEDVILLENVSFQDMFLSDFVYKGLSKNGFVKPSPIQFKAIPLARCGFDLIVQSKSGTGKTLVFVTTALESLDLSINRVQVVVLTPTREIALQVTDVFKAVAHYYKGVSVQAFIGGTPLPKDIKMAANCHIAVGAPGRICQLMKLEHLKTDAVRLFILDEADQLMAKSFQKDINFVYQTLSEFKQMLAISATYPDELIEFIRNYMRSGKLVTPETDMGPLLKGLRQFVSMTRDHPDQLARLSDKENRLVSLLSSVKFNQCLIFSNYQSRAESTCNMLRCQGWSCEWISGKLAQEQRLRALLEIKTGRCRLLVSTDLTARGIDSKGIDLVINMDTPHDPRIYLHRMGRAGRYGSRGAVITILSQGPDCDDFRKMLGLIDKNLAAKVIPVESTVDLWSDQVSDWNQITGIESSLDAVQHKPDFLEKKYKSNNYKTAGKKTALSDTKKMLPPDLSEDNFPSIVLEKGVSQTALSLNEYFLNENEDSGMFQNFASLQESFRKFVLYDAHESRVSNGKEEAHVPAIIKKDQIDDFQTASTSNLKPSSVMESKGTELFLTNIESLKTEFSNEKYDPLKHLLNGQVRRFSYSDITKGKRVRCNPVDPKSDDVTVFKKSPLKFFPCEKVSNKIEGVAISDKALDGFSKRMYSSVVKSGNSKPVPKSIKSLNYNTNETNGEMKVKSQLNSDLNKGKLLEAKENDCDKTDVDSRLKDMLETTNCHKNEIELTPIQKILLEKLLQRIRGNNESEKNVNGTIKLNKLETANELEIINGGTDHSINSVNIENESNQTRSTETSKLSFSSENEQSFNHSITVNCESSRISCRKTSPTMNRSFNVTFEDSSSSDSSLSHGEYIVSRPSAYDSSFNRHRHQSKHKTENRNSSFNLDDWYRLYYHQTSVIYNYIKQTKKYNICQPSYY